MLVLYSVTVLTVGREEPCCCCVGLTFHDLSQEFQKALGSKHSVYDTTARTGRALKDKTTLKDDNQKLDDMLSELRDRWDTVCGKSVERYDSVSLQRWLRFLTPAAALLILIMCSALMIRDLPQTK